MGLGVISHCGNRRWRQSLETISAWQPSVKAKRLDEFTYNSKWDEMDGNAIVNLHLASADRV